MVGPWDGEPGSIHSSLPLVLSFGGLLEGRGVWSGKSTELRGVTQIFSQLVLWEQVSFFCLTSGSLSVNRTITANLTGGHMVLTL